jgi:hypothetical protein
MSESPFANDGFARQPVRRRRSEPDFDAAHRALKEF